MPFFVLDWMLEDLVPDHQDAQDLANLLKEKESSQKRTFSPLRKSKSCGIVGNANNANNSNNNNNNSNKTSPIIQRLLPWSSSASSQRKKNNESNEATKHHHYPAVETYRPATPPVKDAGVPPMPLTPKSSNRKNSKMRQSQRLRETLIDEKKTSDDEMDLLFVRRNLNDSLDDCQVPDTQAANELSTSGDTKNKSPLQFPKFMPRVDSSPPPSHDSPSKICAKANEKDSWMIGGKANGNKLSSSSTKKSASCPQLYQETNNNDDDSQQQRQQQHPPTLQQNHQLRQRAKEQHDRRERRNKLTVVQRSLTLAQGWNNKGLSMAGKATQDEQQYRQNPYRGTSTMPPNPEHWWEASLECWDNALEIYRSLLGEYHERVADVQNNRGIALGKLGRFEEALDALGMALEARKRQEERTQHENERTSSPSSHASAAAPASAAIVSTLHNIANIFRDAGNPSEALKVLHEAQTTLESQVPARTQDDDESSLYHLHHCWHQSARLSTAIGHVYYESESWRDAREAYGEALVAYDKLRRSLGKQSDALGWEVEAQTTALSMGNANETKRLELLHQQQLIQREVSVLQKDLDEIDRSQQARNGSRARLLQARRQQQQQQHQQQHRRPNQQHHSHQQQQQQQQQNQKQQQTLFGIVSSLRT